MPWPAPQIDGFVLAATVAEDRGATAAIDALADALRTPVKSRADAIAALDGAARAKELRRIAASLRPIPRPDGGEALPPRARAILAVDVPKDLGAHWIAGAPPPRRGFAASPALRGVLARIASQPSRQEAETAARERGLGRMLLARIGSELDEDARAGLYESLGAEEAAAVLALRAHVEHEAWDAPTIARVRAFVAVSRPGPERTRAIGAMELGAQGDLAGDARSHAWRRAGAEIRESE